MSLSTAEIVGDAVTKIKSVVQLDSRAGLAAGGHEYDSTMRTAPLPCAWVLYGGMSNNSADPQAIPGVADVTYEIIVKVLLAYNTESDLKNVQYPTLDAVRESMIASKILTSKCEYYKFEAETLEEIDNRLVYVQRYSFNGNL